MKSFKNWFYLSLAFATAILVLVFAASQIPMPEEPEPKVEELAFEKVSPSDGSADYYVVAGMGTYTDTALVIPETYGGLEVKEIKDGAFSDNAEIKSVKIPASVTRVGKSAFANCSSLKSAAFVGSSKLTVIDENAFASCTALAKIDLPSKLQFIKDGAFSNCTAMATVKIWDSIVEVGTDAFAGCSSLTYYEADNGNYIGNNKNPYVVFMSPVSTEETTLTLQKKTKVIAAGALAGYTKLTTVTFDEAFAVIGESAFSGCEGLREITIPKKVSEIPANAFKGCTSLASVNFGDSDVNFIGESAFEGCESLTSITIPKNVSVIPANAFNGCKSLVTVEFALSTERVEVPTEGTDTPDDGAQATGAEVPNDGADVPNEGEDEPNFVEITFSKIEAIGESAFFGCEALTEIVIPEKVTQIPANAFSGCIALKTVVIPEGVQSIGRDAFADCSAVESVKVASLEFWLGLDFASKGANPLSSSEAAKLYTGEGEAFLTELILDADAVVKPYVFCNYKALESLLITDGIKEISDYAFHGCSNLKNVTFPESLISAAKVRIGRDSFTACDNLENVTARIEILPYLPLRNVKTLLVTAGTKVNKDTFLKLESVETLVLPVSVSEVDIGSFDNSKSFKNITVPYCALEKMPSESKVSLTYVEIICKDNAKGVALADGMFEGCNKLETVKLSKNITEIGKNAFNGCSALVSVEICSQIGKIGDGAFSGCKELSTFEFPQNVKYIGANAFKGCEKLTSLFVPSNIGVNNIGANAFDGCTGISTAELPAYAIALVPKDSLVTVTVNGGEVIPEKAFEGCTTLKNVSIPDTVKAIGNGAFTGCTSLVYNSPENDQTRYLGNDTNPYMVLVFGASSDSYTVSENTKFIMDNAYVGVDVKNITVTKNVVSIGCGAFAGSAVLQSVSFANDGKLAYIDDNAFSGCTSLLAVEIPVTVKSIGEKAFENCSALANLVVPKGIGAENIGAGAFYGCTGISTAELPAYAIALIPKDSLVTVTVNGGEVIPEKAFEGCTTLKNVSIPDTIRAIGDGAFTGCTSLVYNSPENDQTRYLGNDTNPYMVLVFGANVEVYEIKNEATRFIMDGAFAGCTELKSIVIPESIIGIGKDAFSDCTNIESATLSVFAANEAGLPRTESLKTLVITGEGYVEKAFSECVNLENLTVANGIDVAEGVFAGCNNIKVADIPANVISEIAKAALVSVTVNGGEINDFAFASAPNLKSVTLSSKVSAVGDYAFFDCDKLDSLVFEEREDGIDIGKNAFAGCSVLTFVAIPDGSSVGECAFLGSALEYIVIGEDVTVGENAFLGTDNLENAYYLGTAGDIAKNNYSYSEAEPQTEGNFWHYDENGVITVWPTVVPAE